MSEGSPSRRPLHERNDSQSNTINNNLAAIRLVPKTPPRLLGGQSQRDEIYSRTPLPTHPSHILLSPGAAKDKGPPALAVQFRTNPNAQGETPSSGSPVSSTHTTHQPPRIGDSATGSPTSKPKPLPKKRLQIHKDNKTFSLLQDDSPSADAGPNSPILLPSKKASLDSLAAEARHAEGRSNSTESCQPTTPVTLAYERKQPLYADPISSSPSNYQFVGGLRKVPKTPDLKQKAATTTDSPLPPLPPLPEVSDGPPASHDLSAKPSFRSTQTDTTTSETTNYKVYGYTSGSTSDVVLPPSSPADSNSNYEIIGEPSELSRESSVIYRPQTAISENSNYEVYGDSSPAASVVDLAYPAKYSQESLIVPPLKPRARRSNEHFGYYKSRSRESLRTGSLTSITTVLSQKEAARAIVGSGNLINLPPLPIRPGASSWADRTGFHPPRSHMNEHPHQWSSQLSTVLSVSDGGSDRNSRSWSDDNGRRSGGYPSTPSRNSQNSRHVLSVSSSLAQEQSRTGSDSLTSPEPAAIRAGRRHLSSSSVPVIGEPDEYGDGITDMQELRNRPSRTRLSGFYSITSSDNGRSNTMRSTNSTRSNSMLASSIPTWARLYYGSGERRYLGAPGSSTESINSRASSFRSGSPNTDHFPLSIYSPRRRPREVNPQTGRPFTQDSMEITPAPQAAQEVNYLNTRRGLRTWSLSSVWSPHLRTDRRATRYSVWDPPSVNWSTDGNWFGRRNVQVVMFIMGFIFPFAWMIGAVLPLPRNPIAEMREREAENSTSNLDSSNDLEHEYNQQFAPRDEARFESARWWRNLNRWMSLVGLAIIATVVTLVVLAFRNGWTKS